MRLAPMYDQHASRETKVTRWDELAWFRIGVAIVIILGISFRIIGLGNKIYSHDEAYTSLRAAGYRGGEVFSNLWDGQDKSAEDIRKFLEPNPNREIGDTISILAVSEPQQVPLFFILAHYWMRIVGYSSAVMRSLAALLSILSAGAIYWLGKELFQSSRIALLATALFSISPYQILFAQDVRPYSLLTLATILSCATLFWAIRKNNAIAWIVYSLSLILGIYSHQLFGLVTIVQGLYFLILWINNRQSGFIGFLSASLFAVLAFLPWIYVIIIQWRYALRATQWTKLSTSWDRYIQRWILIFSSPLIDLDFQSLKLLPYFLRALFLLGLAYAIVFLAMRGSKQQKIFLLLMYFITIGSFVVPDILLGGIRSIHGRFFVPASIVTILVMAFFLSSKLDQSPSGLKWKFLTGLLFLAGIFSNINSLSSETWWNKELSRVGTEFVHKIDKDHSLLIISGAHPTNLGDLLVLSLEANPGMHFRLFEESADIQFQGDYQNIYWFPATYGEVEDAVERMDFQIKEVIPGILWKIDQ